MLGLVPLVFITNLRYAAAAFQNTLGAIRISDVTMARLVLLPYTSVLKNRKQGPDAIPFCHQLGS